MKSYSLSEIAEHNTESDCWIIVNGHVYNVSTYLDDHPGGVEIVTELAGMDASEDYEDAGHSAEADEILKTLCIGKVNETDDALITDSIVELEPELKKPPTLATPTNTTKETKPKESFSYNQRLDIKIAVFVAALGASYYILRKAIRVSSP